LEEEVYIKFSEGIAKEERTRYTSLKRLYTDSNKTHTLGTRKYFAKDRICSQMEEVYIYLRKKMNT